MHDTIVGLVASYGYVVVFLVVGLESMGIPLPGETALVTAAAFAAQGHLSIIGVVTAAAVAAIVGDNGGYWIGRKGGVALIRRHGRRLHFDERKLERVRAFFARHGTKTVFIGRFIALLRTWAAFFAGAGAMPYGEFMFYNALGGVTWAVVYGMLGYVFGRNLPLLERYVGQASLVLVLLAALIAVIALLWRRFASSAPADQAAPAGALATRRRFAAVTRLQARFPRVSEFVAARFTPGTGLGLHLTVGLLVSVTALWLFGAITEDVVHHDPLTLFDIALAHQFRTHATPLGDRVFYAVSVFGAPVSLAVFGAVVAAVLAWRRHSLAFWGWIAAYGGGSVIDWSLKHIIRRPRPPLAEAYYAEHSFSFPSGHATMSLVAFGMLAYLLITFWARRVRAKIAVALLAFVLIVLIGFSRLYLGVHYFSDVVGGYAAATVWVAACASGVEIARRRRHGVAAADRDKRAPDET
jgi:membrane protein DedA with SNARE-associated domain/membrane-associated phospholipid phosphatase